MDKCRIAGVEVYVPSPLGEGQGEGIAEPKARQRAFYPRPAMRIAFVGAYLGRNLYAPTAAIRARCDAGALASWRGTAKLADFIAPLAEHLPHLPARAAGEWRAPSMIVSATGEGGVSLAELVGHAAIELQRTVGDAVEFATTRAFAGSAEREIVVEYQDIVTGQAALWTAAMLIGDLLPAEQRSLAAIPAGYERGAAIRGFLDGARRHGLDLTTRAIVLAAEARGIPWVRLAPGSNIVQLGQGKYQRRITGSASDREGHIAAGIAAGRALSRSVLRSLGVPMAPQRMAPDAAAAAEIARAMGYPVVVRPIGERGGRGPPIELVGPDGFARFDWGRSRVLVEKLLPGERHQILVIGGEMAAAVKLGPGQIVGDGTRTVRALVEEANRQRRVGAGLAGLIAPIELDAAALAALGARRYGPDSVPRAGERIVLRAVVDARTAGSAVDVTDAVHPDMRDLALRAAAGVGLDVAAIDVTTPDIAKSFLEVGAAVSRVAAAPELNVYWAAEGRRRNVVVPILNAIFPAGAEASVPIAAVTGTNGKTTTVNMVAHIFAAMGRTVGVASTVGVSIGGRYIRKGDLAGPPGAEMVLRHRATEIAVLETARRGIIENGLAFKSCRAGAVTNVSMDHLGEFGIGTLEEMARVKGLVVEAASEAAVLNADDPLCVEMAGRCTANRIYFVTMQPDNETVAAHLASGGRAARLVGRNLVLCRGSRSIPLMAIEDLPSAFGGAARHNVQNALFAAAIAHGMDVSLDDIRRGLSSFECTEAMNPGRANLCRTDPFKVVLDYAHNPAAYEAVGRMVRALDGDGRRLCVIAQRENRNDAQVREVAKKVAEFFDVFVCRESGFEPGRATGVPEKLRAALIDCGVAAERISVIPDEEAAVTAGLKMARRGDVVFVQLSPRPGDRMWRLIESFQPA